MPETALPETQPAAPQSLALDAREVAMLKAMGVTWRWPAPEAAVAAEAAPLTAPAAIPPVHAPAQPTGAAAVATAATAPAAPMPHTVTAAAQAPTTSSVTDMAPPERIPQQPATSGAGRVVQPASSPLQALAPLALNGVDWATLQGQVQQCQSCHLHHGRSDTSWGQGDSSARWLFVTAGLNPTEFGADPVQGNEWQLLQSMWRAMGIAAADAFVTSLTKCRPAMGVAPSAQDTAQCLQYLERQHQLLQPTMVVALGLPVAHALLGANTAPLSQWRGQVHQWRDAPLVVTYPLDTLVRRPIDQGKAWADLCLALEHATARTPTETPQP